jgi:Recombinase
VAIAELARWLGSTGVTTRTGKARWDRSTIWGMLRNPAYAGRACFGKTGRLSQQVGRNRVARLAGRAAGATGAKTGANVLRAPADSARPTQSVCAGESEGTPRLGFAQTRAYQPRLLRFACSVRFSQQG